MSSLSTDTPSGGIKRRAVTVCYGIVAAAVIGTASFFSIQAASGGTDLRSNLTFIAPGSAGGGHDTFAREQQQALRANGVVNSSEVVNVPGAGGTIALGQLTTMTGQANTIMGVGTVMLGGIALNDSPVDLTDVTPIARLAEEYNVFIVPADSSLNNLADLVGAWKQNPKALAFTGGSAGGVDHLAIANLAIQAGIDPTEITYIPKAGGGEAIQTMMSGTAKVLSSGYAEVSDQIESGRVKALGVTAPERFEGVDIATFAEQGFPTDLTNWRGMVAPPGITDEQRVELQQLLEEMLQTPEWKESLDRNQWTEVYLPGEQFEQFIEEDQASINALIKELDL
ncbi:tripartite tricarboxylate transporter substrate binding protein [Arthrobacter sp. Z4-13]